MRLVTSGKFLPKCAQKFAMQSAMQATIPPTGNSIPKRSLGRLTTFSTSWVDTESNLSRTSHNSITSTISMHRTAKRAWSRYAMPSLGLSTGRFDHRLTRSYTMCFYAFLWFLPLCPWKVLRRMCCERTLLNSSLAHIEVTLITVF